jgi:oxidase EvaA
MISKKISLWLNKQKKNNKLNVKIVNLNLLKNWQVKDKKINHISNKFFQIIGIKVSSNFYKKNWDQPIIVQNEVGILGIIKNKKTNKYLLQAKVEPGNINKLQIAPTVQATKSNYSGVHGGSKVPYINYFLKFKNLTKYNQSEQGFRYLFKFNLNILIEVSTKIKSMPNFYWLTKNEIKKLINERSVLNMDTISVLSCFVTKFKSNYSINSKKKNK